MSDFVASNDGGFLAAAKFVNGNSPADDSSFGAAIPEPGPLALFSTSLIVAGSLMRRRRRH